MCFYLFDVCGPMLLKLLNCVSLVSGILSAATATVLLPKQTRALIGLWVTLSFFLLISSKIYLKIVKVVSNRFLSYPFCLSHYLCVHADSY